MGYIAVSNQLGRQRDEGCARGRIQHIGVYRNENRALVK